jgi:cytolysin-activating lysine-acyltransferase
MKTDAIRLICPSVETTEKSEAELFGAMVWLWMHSSVHRQCPIHELGRLIVPALKSGQFVLALQNDALQQPVGLMTWANFDADTEQRYMRSLDRTLLPTDWQAGDRPWILDWVVPFGHSHAMSRSIRRLLPNACFKSLYHKGDLTGMKALFFRGMNITQAQERQFWAARPSPITQK